MPITVPKSNAVQFPGAKGDMPMVPTESDLWMALAIMQGKGQVASRMNPSAQGEIEDRRDVEQPEMMRLRSAMGNMGLPQSEPLPNLRGSNMAKDAGIETVDAIPVRPRRKP